jgi:hypothetical protein
MEYLRTLETFTEDSLPDLDVAVLGALEFFDGTVLPELAFGEFERPLVVGSGNAAIAGRILFSGTRAIFANESTFDGVFRNRDDFDAVVVVSASGGKHAAGIVNTAVNEGVDTFLITNTEDSPSGKLLEPSRVQVLPKVREPYTYNVSTYLGMFLTQERIAAADLAAFIEGRVAPRVPENFSAYDAFFITVPESLDAVKGMLATKFDELFGAKVSGRVFTLEEAKHAKTVVPSESECFLSFGEENAAFGAPDARVFIPLPEQAGPAALMTVAYYVIGCIQKQHPPYFKEHIAAYAREASEIFNQEIRPIVE